MQRKTMEIFWMNMSSRSCDDKVYTLKKRIAHRLTIYNTLAQRYVPKRKTGRNFGADLNFINIYEILICIVKILRTLFPQSADCKLLKKKSCSNASRDLTQYTEYNSTVT